MDIAKEANDFVGSNSIENWDIENENEEYTKNGGVMPAPTMVAEENFKS